MKNIIENYGYTEFYKAQEGMFDSKEKGLIPGRIIEVQREQYKIITDEGESAAKLKGSLFYNEAVASTYPAVGDFVLVKHNPYGEDIIYHVLERKSKFSRLDSFNEIEQIVATNFDCVFIMTSLNNDFNIKKVERYLTTAWQSGAVPVIVLTKADLCSDYNAYMEQIEQIAFGVSIVPISSVTREGLEKLEQFIKPSSTVVFLGSSGVGKSSLVNTIAGEEIMKVNDIREDDSKGRHTTTHRQLIMLKNGSMIIDTPGMRELGMWNVSEGLDTAFTDIEELSRECKFSDCSHENEPGCAVKKALESGELSIKRWESYLKLKKEIKFAELKESVDMRLKEKARWKSLSKFQKQFKKGGGQYV
jgi:ribosome biogenesis GTPase / thiamine phosphate phosphatase